MAFHNIVDKDPGVMVPRNYATNEFKIEGDTFTWTSKANQNGAYANPITTKPVRVE